MSRCIPLVSVAIALAMIVGCASSDYPQKNSRANSPTVGPRKISESSLALGGDCPVCLVEMGKTVAGKEEYSSVYNGYKYLFPSPKQKRMFDAKPVKYAVQDHGDCVVCKVEMNKEVKGDPKIYSLHNKKIYLFVGDKQKKMFTSNPKKYTGEAEMPQKDRRAASTATVGPKKTSKASLTLGGDCPVCLVEMGKTVAGKEEYSSVYDGYKYLFPSPKQKRMFDAKPVKYAVQDHGDCVVCKVEMNKEVKGDPKIYSLHNKKIYLFVGDKQKKMFTSNPKKYTGKAEMPQKDRRAASTATVGPKKTSKASLALGGDCPVCLVEMGKTVAGKEEYSSVYDGYKYLFPSPKQKRMFDAKPVRYAVQDHGDCVVCKVEMNKEIKGDPKIYSLYNKKIYLFVGDKQKKMFTSNPKKYTDEAKMPQAEGSGTTRE